MLSAIICLLEGFSGQSPPYAKHWAAKPALQTPGLHRPNVASLSLVGWP